MLPKLPKLPVWAWVVGAGVAGVAVWIYTSKPKTDKKPGERIGEAIIDATATLANAGVGVIRGAGNAIAGKVWPVDACVASMRAGSVWGASWDCTPATFIEWIKAGRPSNVSLMSDGKIYAPAVSPATSTTTPAVTPARKGGGASGSWLTFAEWATDSIQNGELAWMQNTSDIEQGRA